MNLVRNQIETKKIDLHQQPLTAGGRCAIATLTIGKDNRINTTMWQNWVGKSSNVNIQANGMLCIIDIIDNVVGWVVVHWDQLLLLKDDASTLATCIIFADVSAVEFGWCFFVVVYFCGFLYVCGFCDQIKSNDDNDDKNVVDISIDYTRFYDGI